MSRTYEEWIEDHYSEETGEYEFAPDELSFCVVTDTEDEPFVIVIPTRIWEEEGRFFDNHFEVTGEPHFLFPLEESVFELRGEVEEVRQYLLDLGLTENEELGQIGPG